MFPLPELPPVRRILKRLAWLRGTPGRYPYQIPLSAVPGPRVQANGREWMMLSSYDYLDLAGHPALAEASCAAVRRFGAGTGGVRLLTGTCELHLELEAALAEFTGHEAAMVFTSGYLANLAVLPALFTAQDLVLADSHIHRSLIAGLHLGALPYRFFQHNDPEDLERELKKGSGKRILILTEGVFSMDGDICPLPEIIALKKRYGAFLLVDEAHSLGVLGPGGRGVAAHFGVPADEIDLLTGSLSKALSSGGGFVAANAEAIEYLRHGAAPYIFSSAPAPASAAAAKAALDTLAGETWRLAALRNNADLFRRLLREAGFDTGRSGSPVIPVILGADDAAFCFAQQLQARGVLASPVVFPAVKPERARLRLCATAGMQESFIREAVAVFESLKA